MKYRNKLYVRYYLNDFFFMFVIIIVDFFISIMMDIAMNKNEKY